MYQAVSHSAAVLVCVCAGCDMRITCNSASLQCRLLLKA